MTLTTEQELQLLKLRAQNLGWKKLSKKMNIAPSTLRDNFKRLTAPSPAPSYSAEPIEKGQDKTAPITHPDIMDWGKELDTMGRSIVGLVRKAEEGGNYEDLKEWIETYIKAFRAKTGAVRIYQDNRVQVISLDNPEVRSLLEIEMKEKARQFIEQMEQEMDEFKFQQRTDWNVILGEIEEKHGVNCKEWMR